MNEEDLESDTIFYIFNHNYFMAKLLLCMLRERRKFEFDVVDKWMIKLCDETSNLDEAKIRNDLMFRLACQLEAHHLSGPFSKAPPDSSLLDLMDFQTVDKRGNNYTQYCDLEKRILGLGERNWKDLIRSHNYLDFSSNQRSLYLKKLIYGSQSSLESLNLSDTIREDRLDIKQNENEDSERYVSVSSKLFYSNILQLSYFDPLKLMIVINDKPWFPFKRDLESFSLKRMRNVSVTTDRVESRVQVTQTDNSTPNSSNPYCFDRGTSIFTEDTTEQSSIIYRNIEALIRTFNESQNRKGNRYAYVENQSKTKTTKQCEQKLQSLAQNFLNETIISPETSFQDQHSLSTDTEKKVQTNLDSSLSKESENYQNAEEENEPILRSMCTRTNIYKPTDYMEFPPISGNDKLVLNKQVPVKDKSIWTLDHTCTVIKGDISAIEDKIPSLSRKNYCDVKLTPKSNISFPVIYERTEEMTSKDTLSTGDQNYVPSVMKEFMNKKSNKTENVKIQFTETCSIEKQTVESQSEDTTSLRSYYTSKSESTPSRRGNQFHETKNIEMTNNSTATDDPCSLEIRGENTNVQSNKSQGPDKVCTEKPTAKSLRSDLSLDTFYTMTRRMEKQRKEQRNTVKENVQQQQIFEEDCQQNASWSTPEDPTTSDSQSITPELSKRTYFKQTQILKTSHQKGKSILECSQEQPSVSEKTKNKFAKHPTTLELMFNLPKISEETIARFSSLSSARSRSVMDHVDATAESENLFNLTLTPIDGIELNTQNEDIKYMNSKLTIDVFKTLGDIEPRKDTYRLLQDKYPSHEKENKINFYDRGCREETPSSVNDILNSPQYFYKDIRNNLKKTYMNFPSKLVSVGINDNYCGKVTSDVNKATKLPKYFSAQGPWYKILRSVRKTGQLRRMLMDIKNPSINNLRQRNKNPLSVKSVLTQWWLSTPMSHLQPNDRELSPEGRSELKTTDIDESSHDIHSKDDGGTINNAYNSTCDIQNYFNHLANKLDTDNDTTKNITKRGGKHHVKVNSKHCIKFANKSDTENDATIFTMNSTESSSKTDVKLDSVKKIKIYERGEIEKDTQSDISTDTENDIHISYQSDTESFKILNGTLAKNTIEKNITNTVCCDIKKTKEIYCQIDTENGSKITIKSIMNGDTNQYKSKGFHEYSEKDISDSNQKTENIYLPNDTESDRKNYSTIVPKIRKQHFNKNGKVDSKKVANTHFKNDRSVCFKINAESDRKTESMTSSILDVTNIHSSSSKDKEIKSNVCSDMLANRNIYYKSDNESDRSNDKRITITKKDSKCDVGTYINNDINIYPNSDAESDRKVINCPDIGRMKHNTTENCIKRDIYTRNENRLAHCKSGETSDGKDDNKIDNVTESKPRKSISSSSTPLSSCTSGEKKDLSWIWRRRTAVSAAPQVPSSSTSSQSLLEAAWVALRSNGAGGGAGDGTGRSCRRRSPSDTNHSRAVPPPVTCTAVAPSLSCECTGRRARREREHRISASCPALAMGLCSCVGCLRAQACGCCAQRQPRATGSAAGSAAGSAGASERRRAYEERRERALLEERLWRREQREWLRRMRRRQRAAHAATDTRASLAAAAARRYSRAPPPPPPSAQPTPSASAVLLELRRLAASCKESEEKALLRILLQD